MNLKPSAKQSNLTAKPLNPILKQEKTSCVDDKGNNSGKKSTKAPYVHPAPLLSCPPGASSHLSSSLNRPPNPQLSSPPQTSTASVRSHQISSPLRTTQNASPVRSPQTSITQVQSSQITSPLKSPQNASPARSPQTSMSQVHSSQISSPLKTPQNASPARSPQTSMPQVQSPQISSPVRPPQNSTTPVRSPEVSKSPERSAQELQHLQQIQEHYRQQKQALMQRQTEMQRQSHMSGSNGQTTNVHQNSSEQFQKVLSQASGEPLYQVVQKSPFKTPPQPLYQTINQARRQMPHSQHQQPTGVLQTRTQGQTRQITPSQAAPAHLSSQAPHVHLSSQAAPSHLSEVDPTSQLLLYVQREMSKQKSPVQQRNQRNYSVDQLTSLPPSSHVSVPATTQPMSSTSQVISNHAHGLQQRSFSTSSLLPRQHCDIRPICPSEFIEEEGWEEGQESLV